MNFLKKGADVLFKKRKIILITSLIIIIAISFGAYHFFSSRYIKYVGTTLTPSKDYPIYEIKYYLQNDPDWANDKIGSSNSKMGGAGCLITCVASSMTNLGMMLRQETLMTLLQM